MGLYYIFERTNFYDTLNGPLDPREEEAEAQRQRALAREKRTGSMVSHDTDDTGELRASTSGIRRGEVELDPNKMAYVTGALVKLSSEAANLLAVGMRRIDTRQRAIERRQTDLTTSVRGMQKELQNVQSNASAAALRLHWNMNGQSKAPTRRQKTVPACFDWSPGLAESSVPAMRSASSQ